MLRILFFDFKLIKEKNQCCSLFYESSIGFQFTFYSNSIYPSSPIDDELPPDEEPPLEEEPELPPLGVLLLPESTVELPEVVGAEAFCPSTSRL